MAQTQVCSFCKNPFEITDDDLAFYKKIDVPPPKFCPNDRLRRRAACRNERHMYRRKCTATGKDIVSMYSPDKPYPVYDQEYWWGDSWDPLSYGQDFDFNKPFFEQFKELQSKVPRLSMYNYNSENSYYTVYSGENKNCYMCVDLGGCEDVYFSNWIVYGRHCIDCSYTYNSELCYQCLYCEKCFNCDFCQECENCTDCAFSYDLKGCSNCFGCAGLRNKQYHVGNKPVSKEEYQKIVSRYQYSYAKQREALVLFEKTKLSVPHKYAIIVDSENCSGDYIYHSKNARECYDAVRLWDCKYCYNTLDTKDGYDCYQPGFADSELIYEVHGGNTLVNCKFIMTSSKNLRDCAYCDQCFYSENLFGCSGIKRGKYCILNKQYDKSSFDRLRMTIIENMKKTGEFGEFFPLWCSPFGYNESKAQEYFPLTREEVARVGSNWCDYEQPSPRGEMVEPPDDVRLADDSITEKVISCAGGGKPFRIIKQELDFYRRKKLPIPRMSPQKRYEERIALRRPRRLWNRPCMKCNAPMRTTYSPDRPESVYCEKCYLNSTY